MCAFFRPSDRVRLKCKLCDFFRADCAIRKANYAINNVNYVIFFSAIFKLVFIRF